MVQPSSVRLVTEDKRGRDLRWYCPPSWTSVDEFNDDTLDAAWGRVDANPTRANIVTWGEFGDSLTAVNTGTDGAAELHSLVRPLSGVGGSLAVGDGFVTAVQGTTLDSDVNTKARFGLILSDGNTWASGSTQVLAELNIYMSGSLSIMEMFTVSHFGFDTNGSRYTANGYVSPLHPGVPLFMRLSRTATNSWRSDFSIGGGLWVRNDVAPLTFTPTHVGFYSSSTNSTRRHIVTFDFLRRVSGVS